MAIGGEIVDDGIFLLHDFLSVVFSMVARMRRYSMIADIEVPQSRVIQPPEMVSKI